MLEGAEGFFSGCERIKRAGEWEFLEGALSASGGSTVLLDQAIASGRFCEYIADRLERLGRKEADRAAWEFYLCKVREGSFAEFERELAAHRESDRTTATTSSTDPRFSDCITTAPSHTSRSGASPSHASPSNLPIANACPFSALVADDSTSDHAGATNHTAELAAPDSQSRRTPTPSCAPTTSDHATDRVTHDRIAATTETAELRAACERILSRTKPTHPHSPFNR